MAASGDGSGQQLLPTKAHGSGGTPQVVGEVNLGYAPIPPQEMVTMLGVVALILLGLKRVETNENEDVIQLLVIGFLVFVVAWVIYGEFFARGPERRKRIAGVLLATYTIALFFGLLGVIHPPLTAFSFLPALIYALIAYRRGAFQ